MRMPLLPLNALRAFEAAARHLSLTEAALELHVTPSALSHQIRGLEAMLGLKLFERRVRAIELTPAGKQLYPGLHLGFTYLRDAVASLSAARDANILVVSAPPGFTSKWLAPKLYRFSSAYPDLDTRVSSSLAFANFMTDGVDVAIRSLPGDAAAPAGLVMEKIIQLAFLPVCSPSLLKTHGPFSSPESFEGIPLIHDDSFAARNGMSKWGEWFRHVGVDGIDVTRGLRFNSSDHALEAAIEGTGVLLAPDALAYEELRSGRLAIAVNAVLKSDRAYFFVCPDWRQDQAKVRAFRAWIKQEAAAVDLRTILDLSAAR